jgi:hypothetical protein
MPMSRSVALVAAVLASSTAFATDAPRVELGGFGTVRVGMSPRQVSQATGSALVHADPGAGEHGCFYASVAGLPEGVDLMFLDERLARIDVFAPSVRTWAGIGIGTPESTVKAIHGSGLQQQPHAYGGPSEHYLTLLSADGGTGIRFETDGESVSAYYTGTPEAIRLVEGCQ